MESELMLLYSLEEAPVIQFFALFLSRIRIRFFNIIIVFQRKFTIIHVLAQVGNDIKVSFSDFIIHSPILLGRFTTWKRYLFLILISIYVSLLVERYILNFVFVLLRHRIQIQNSLDYHWGLYFLLVELKNDITVSFSDIILISPVIPFVSIIPSRDWKVHRFRYAFHFSILTWISYQFID